MKLTSPDDAGLLANNSTRVSPISTINGYDAVTYLTQLASTLGFQDPDARYACHYQSIYHHPNNAYRRYNEMFPSAAREVALGVEYGAWTSNNGRWPGSAEFTVTFGNGSITQVPTVAEVYGGQKFTYTNGSSIYEAVCSSTDSSSSESSTSTSKRSTAKTNSAPKTYPEPVMRDAYNLIIGYYLNETDMQDVAVLFVPSFDTADMSLREPLAFANHATQFIQQAVAAGKKKLIIDLTSNPGGTVSSGMDLFKLFFPEKPVYSSTRFRDHEVVNIIGQALNTIPHDSDYWDIISKTPFVGVTPNQTYAYKSWKEYSGPHYQLGANMTSLAAVSNLTLTSTWTTPIRGYGIVKQNMTSSPFAPEDILLVPLSQSSIPSPPPTNNPPPDNRRLLQLHLHHLRRTDENLRWRQNARLRRPPSVRPHGHHGRSPGRRIPHLDHNRRIHRPDPRICDRASPAQQFRALGSTTCPSQFHPDRHGVAVYMERTGTEFPECLCPG